MGDRRLKSRLIRSRSVEKGGEFCLSNRMLNLRQPYLKRTTAPKYLPTDLLPYQGSDLLSLTERHRIFVLFVPALNPAFAALAS